MNYKQAKIADSAKVAKETVLVGDITIGEESTVLFFTAMRCEGEESIGSCLSVGPLSWCRCPLHSRPLKTSLSTVIQ